MNHFQGISDSPYFWDKPILNHQHTVAFYGSSCISSDQCWCQPLCTLQKCFLFTLLWSVLKDSSARPETKENSQRLLRPLLLWHFGPPKMISIFLGYHHPGKDWSLVGIFTFIKKHHSHGAEDSIASWPGGRSLHISHETSSTLLGHAVGFIDCPPSSWMRLFAEFLHFVFLLWFFTFFLNSLL